MLFNVVGLPYTVTINSYPTRYIIISPHIKMLPFDVIPLSRMNLLRVIRTLVLLGAWAFQKYYYYSRPGIQILFRSSTLVKNSNGIRDY